jgi:hypothetical protein
MHETESARATGRRPGMGAAVPRAVVTAISDGLFIIDRP